MPFLAPLPPRAHTLGMQTAVTLTLNGEARAFDGPMTVASLLTTLGLETRKVAVERNEEIVPRSVYSETWLQSGDALEIVHFIGGG
ncbi:MAG TPA: sulfur carrier protein ThiS [Acetobacteraceae bacterium]|nr:sulfur carrier protein ThiS [Acetobacteraceae bacterium]